MLNILLTKYITRSFFWLFSFSDLISQVILVLPENKPDLYIFDKGKKSFIGYIVKGKMERNAHLYITLMGFNSVTYYIPLSKNTNNFFTIYTKRNKFERTIPRL